MTPLRKVLLLLLVNALLLSACSGGLSSNQGSPGSIPVKGGLSSYTKLEIPKEIAETGSGFFLAEVEDEVLEESSEIQEGTVAAEVIVEDEVEKVVGQAIASEGGVSAFYDPVVETTIPVQVINSEGEPVPGAIVEYLALDGVVIIKASDPEGTYVDSIAVIEYGQLTGGEETGSLMKPFRDLFLPRPVYAEGLISPAFLAPVVVLVLGAVAVYGTIVLISEMHAVITNPKQMQETEDLSEQIWCETPEGLAAKMSISVDVVFGFVTGLLSNGDELIELILHAGEITAKEVQSALDAKSIQEPVLVKRTHHLLKEIEPGSSSTESSMGGITTASAYITYEDIGTCAEVPDLEGMDWIAAQSILEEREIHWEVEYQALGEIQELPSYTSGVVQAQSLPALRDNGNHTLIPLGDWPELNNTLGITVIPISPLPALEVPTSPTCADYFGDDLLLWEFGSDNIACGFAYNCKTEKLPGGMEETCRAAAPDLILDTAFAFTEDECHCAFNAPEGQYQLYAKNLEFWTGEVNVLRAEDSMEEVWSCLDVAKQSWHFSWLDSYLYYADDDGDGLPDLEIQLDQVVENCGSIDRTIFQMDDLFR